MSRNIRVGIFWLVLTVLFVTDWLYTPAIDLRFEAPAIAAGSGKASVGGHCSGT